MSDTPKEETKFKREKTPFGDVIISAVREPIPRLELRDAIYYAQYPEKRAEALEKIKEILSKPINLNEKFVTGYGDMQLPIEQALGDLEIMDMLIKHGAKTDSLSLANVSTDPEIVQGLIDRGVTKGMTECLARTSDPEVAKVLLANGAELEAKLENGQTALHELAALTGYRGGSRKVDVVKLLIEEGADVNARDKGGKTPLDKAMEGPLESEEVIKMLKDAGAKTGEELGPLPKEKEFSGEEQGAASDNPAVSSLAAADKAAVDAIREQAAKGGAPAIDYGSRENAGGRAV